MRDNYIDYNDEFRSLTRVLEDVADHDNERFGWYPSDTERALERFEAAGFKIVSIATGRTFPRKKTAP
jgi:hypothetical protein